MTAVMEQFTHVYRNFTDLYRRSMAQEEDESKIPEKVIRCVWNDQLFKSPALQTTSGRGLEVVFPGYWNFGSGPDFKQAVIRVDGEEHEGDVELHVFGCDWNAHGHSENNEYDNVVLHVFLWQDRRGQNTQTSAPAVHQSRPHIFELELKHHLKEGVFKLTDELDFDSYPVLNEFNTGLCHQPLSQLSPEKLEVLLNAAGDARVQSKMDRFHDRIIVNGYEQTFYEGLAEALGYPANKAPFKSLAERVSVNDLRQLLPGKNFRGNRILPLQAVLFGVSGLLTKKFPRSGTLDGEDKTYIDALNKAWEALAPRFAERMMPVSDWKFGRMRPANLPYRRIAAMAHLAAFPRGQGLFDDFISCLNSTVSISKAKGYTGASGKRVLEFFCLEADDYWSRHYTPGGKKLLKNQYLIGSERAREMLINIGIPIALIYARASRSPELESRLHELFQKPSPSVDNQWLRFMKHYILGNQDRLIRTLKSDQQTQGLMQVYQDFCTRNNNNCLRCRFPEVVKRYFS